MRRRVVWLVGFPLVVAGSQVAHDLAYRLVYPTAGERTHVLAATGHGYLHDALLGVVVGLAAVVAALLFRVVDVRRDSGAPAVRVPPVQFAVLPLALFVLQEELEQLFHGGSPLAAALEPTFRVGLVLQLPLALAAYVVTRVLLRAADRVGWALRPRKRRPLLLRTPRALRPIRIELARCPGVLALGRAGRAPPASAVF